MKVLIVVDVQNDFVNGALGTEEAKGIVAAVQEKVKKEHKEGSIIIYTQDTHGRDYLQTQEGKNLPIEHCLKGTEGWEIVPGVYLEGTEIVEKPGFGSLELADKVAAMEEVNSIELIGIATDICVISNALILKARLPEVPITVDASCCAGITPASHSNALEAMKMCQIIITGE